jgi:uncharacterized protein YcbX
MQVIGRVESVWRYPVKSMRGESLKEGFLGFPGVYGDRLWAFLSSASIKGFPFFTGREQPLMVQYRPVFRNPEAMAKPINLAEADALGPGVTPLYAPVEDWAVDIETPSGETLAIDDPKLIALLKDGAREAHQLSLLRSERALTDCRPISLFSLQTAAAYSVGPGRFRSNLYVDLTSGSPYGEDELVGKQVRIGSKAIVSVTDRDPRCKLFTVVRDTSEANPDVIRRAKEERDGKLGVYGAVLVEGMVRPGDEIVIIN